MNTRACTLCNLPVRPGEPVRHASPIDVRDGRIVALPARSYHTGGACLDARRAYGLPARPTAIVA